MMGEQRQDKNPMSKIRILDLKEVPEGKAKRVEVGSLRIAVTRIGDELYAVGDMCTHANYALSEGPVDTDDITIECWKHGAQFCLETGEPISLPATRAVPTYQIESDDQSVYVLLPDKGQI
tara:strand:+ start:916 stop:1278 length:363 start_codon:yes stop_codon:yes gene_type:complete